MARGNPQWRELAAVEQCLVVFQGPQQYITPSWYPTKQEHGKVVPTWNYVTVHAWGAPQVIEDTAWLRRQIEDLTNLNEGVLPKPWKVDDAPEQYLASQMKGIIGIEIPIAQDRRKVEGQPEPARGGSRRRRRGLARKRRAGQRSWPRWWPSAASARTEPRHAVTLVFPHAAICSSVPQLVARHDAHKFDTARD